MLKCVFVMQRRKKSCECSVTERKADELIETSKVEQTQTVRSCVESAGTQRGRFMSSFCFSFQNNSSLYCSLTELFVWMSGLCRVAVILLSPR